MPGYERPREKSSNKSAGEKYDVPCCDVKFYLVYKCIKYFGKNVFLSRSWKRYTKAFAKVRIIVCAWRS